MIWGRERSEKRGMMGKLEMGRENVIMAEEGQGG